MLHFTIDCAVRSAIFSRCGFKLLLQQTTLEIYKSSNSRILQLGTDKKDGGSLYTANMAKREVIVDCQQIDLSGVVVLPIICLLMCRITLKI